VVNADNLEILSVFCAKGKVHDFMILKKSRLSIRREIKKLLDLAYQGIHKLYSNAWIPFKKPRNGKLSPEQKRYNRELSKKRILVEHVNRKCKIFRAVKETYRGKHKNYGKTWNLIAALVNLRYAQ